MSVKQLARSIRQKQIKREPLWAGPTAQGERGGVAQSLLARFLNCRERFRIRYIEGLQPARRWEPKTGYGDMWHVCEEAHAGLGNLGVLLHAYVQEQCRLYPLQQEDIAKWYAICRTQFPVYADYWAKHPDVTGRTPLMQEQVFDVPYKLPSGRVVRLRGKFDSVDLIENTNPQYQGNDRVGPKAGIWLQENKTKSKINEQQLKRQLSFDLQTMFYRVALDIFKEQLGLEEGDIEGWCRNVPILGVRYNVIRRDCPVVQHKDRQLKAGFKRGETVEEWCERLRKDYFAADPADWFFRWQVNVSAEDVAKFRRECLDPILEQLCWWYDITVGKKVGEVENAWGFPPMHFRHPYGVYNVLAEGGIDDMDEHLANGSEVGLTRERGIFEELA